MALFILTLRFIVLAPLILITFFPSNLHLHLHDILFNSVFYVFIHVILENTLRFKYFVLFATHTLLEKLLRD